MQGNNPIDDLRLSEIDHAEHHKLIEMMTKSFKYAEVDGKKMIQTLNGEFVEYNLMDQEYFNENWLSQFAIGRVGEANFFNMQGWYELTDGFTKGVVVINEQKEFLFLIRKFTDMNLDNRCENAMSYCGRYVSRAKDMPEGHERNQVINDFAAQISTIVDEYSDQDSSNLTKMVPDWYYKQQNVSPETMQQVIYIREYYPMAGSKLDPDSEVMKRVQNVLYKWNTEKVVSAGDKAFILEITNNEFNFDAGDNNVEEKVHPQQAAQPEQQPADFDPFSD